MSNQNRLLRIFRAKSKLPVHQNQETFANVPVHNQIVPVNALKPNIVLCLKKGFKTFEPGNFVHEALLQA